MKTGHCMMIMVILNNAFIYSFAMGYYKFGHFQINMHEKKTVSNDGKISVGWKD